MPCQEEVPKKKARPLRRPAIAGFSALLSRNGGCGTRTFGPQTVLALFPLRLALLDDAEGMRENQSVINGQRLQITFEIPVGVLFPPLVKRRATEASRGKSASTV